jgi:starvation-inducible DNA-binding protein
MTTTETTQGTPEDKQQRMSTTPTGDAASFHVPGMEVERSQKVAKLLQDRLVALLDLQLTLKHIHWNVIGPSFIGVHEMLDQHVIAARDFSDAIAERIATLGYEPVGTPGFVVDNRSWDDYDLLRAGTQAHLAKLDEVYKGVVEDHRVVMDELDELDPVSQDMIIGQLNQLEQYQWFVRAHLETNTAS